MSTTGKLKRWPTHPKIALKNVLAIAFTVVCNYCNLIWSSIPIKSLYWYQNVSSASQMSQMLHFLQQTAPIINICCILLHLTGAWHTLRKYVPYCVHPPNSRASFTRRSRRMFLQRDECGNSHTSKKVIDKTWYSWISWIMSLFPHNKMQTDYTRQAVFIQKFRNTFHKISTF